MIMSKSLKQYRQAVQYLYNLQKFGIKFGLSQTANLLAAMGNPQEGRQYVHIGGTNGKGSVGSFLASILKEAGLCVGFYSSPHLVRFTERFKVDNREISREKVVSLVNEVKTAVVDHEPPTYFEATTAMAFAYFNRENTDLSIMEVGMGGRLDATNVITPRVSVITNISLEHQEYLGSRLLDIAGEKAGIIKKGIPVVTGVTQPAVIDLIRTVCKKKGAPLVRVGSDVRYRRSASGLNYYGTGHRFKRLELGLTGDYQGRNAALALAALECLEQSGFAVSSAAIRSGLKKAVWPGRMHIISRNPTILLDGAHNPAAIRTLVRTVNRDMAYRRLLLVIGIMEDKAIGPMLKTIVPHADRVFYTRPTYSRAADPGLLMNEAASLHRPGEAVESLADAIERAKKSAGPQDLILICGSLFTVGEALSYLDPETYGSEDP